MDRLEEEERGAQEQTLLGVDVWRGQINYSVLTKAFKCSSLNTATRGWRQRDALVWGFPSLIKTAQDQSREL